MSNIAMLREIDAILTVEWEQASDAVAVREFFANLPVPGWVKTLDGEIVACNPAYTRRYGVGGDQWPQEVLDTFLANDQKVIREQKACTFVETVINPITRQQENIVVIKFPLHSGDNLVGVAGIAVYLPV
jgi:PAS domain-containing protein